MRYSFREYLLINESVKEKIFTITINDINYTIDRRGHLLTKRKGDNKPKDFKMSKEKYKKAIQQALESDLDLTKSFSLTWEDNGKNNIISLIMKDSNTFSIFGAIMNSEKPEDELYKAAEQRLKINIKD